MGGIITGTHGTHDHARIAQRTQGHLLARRVTLEGAHTILSGDLVLSGAIWRKSAHQRPRAPLGGCPSQGRWQRLIGAAFLFQ